MVCIYCGKKLTMVKKLTSEDFCSVAHRLAYHGEQEKLAVARLVDQQLRMGPPRKSAASVQPIYSDAALPQSSHPGEYLAQKFAPHDSRTALWVPHQQLAIALLPFEPESSATIAPAHGPASAITVNGGLRALDRSTLAQSPSPTETAAAFKPYSPRVDSLAPNFIPVSARVLAFDRPSYPQSNSQLLVDVESDFEAPDQSSIVRDTIPCPKAPAPSAVLQSYGAKRFSFSRMPDAQTQRDINPAPPPPPAVDAPSFGQATIQSNLHQPGPNQFDFPNPSQLQPHSQVVLSADISVRAESVAFNLLPNSLPDPVAKLLQSASSLSTGPGLCLGLATVAPQPNLIAGGATPRYLTHPNPRAPRPPNSAALPAIAVCSVAAVVPGNSGAAEHLLARTSAKCQSFDSEALLPALFLRVVPSAGVADRVAPMSPKARVVGVRRSSLEVQPTSFRPSQMLPVPLKAISVVNQPRLRDAVAMERLAIFRPQLKFKIIPARDHGSPLAGLSELAGGKFILSWGAVKRRWAEAPNDLRWIAVAVPMVICLIWFANSPGLKDNTKHNVADKVSSIAPNFTGLFNNPIDSESFSNLRNGIQRRAAVELSDDFRQGLGEWGGKGDWAKGWNYDPAGFIRPRQLALYTPSIPLENYRFEFLGAIEKKALSWVFRAADLKNYYASRLEITRGGPIPTVELVRFAVIDGRPGPRKSIPLPFQGRLDTIYRVAVEVHGTDFVITVQGQVVDVFSDDRLARGGVGFYTEAGEDARLRWVEVSHQYDFLGRLCAFLVPYNVSNSNVRSEQ